MSPSSATRVLLERLFDYAGLFPPAALPMDQAWRQYQEHMAGEEAWLAGTFICPAQRLPELAGCAGIQHARLTLTLLGRKSEASALLNALKADLACWSAFASKHHLAKVTAWEVRLPMEVPAASELESLLAQAGDLLPPGSTISWEADPQWSSQRLLELAQCLRTLNAGQRRHGLKLRCGGLSAQDFPAPRRVAEVIALARDHGLALKCTAGLHHPLRHFRPELGTYMHGFLNVWGAAHLAWRHALGVDEICAVLELEGPGDFQSGALGLQVAHRFVESEAMQRQRHLLPGHGTCSIAESVEDLIGLGWLPGPSQQQERVHGR